jgi:uncharacterized protein YqcC (DUF446 family)
MTRADQVLEKLQQIEGEMRRIGFWNEALNEQRVNQQAVAFAEQHGKSPVGNMPFEHWLQAVFIPNARDAARNNSLPSSSNVAVMAMREYDYHSHVTEAQELLQLLREFDGLFSSNSHRTVGSDHANQ